MSQEETENYNETDIKEELYMLYLEIKENLTKKKYRIKQGAIRRSSRCHKIKYNNKLYKGNGIHIN